MAILCDNYIDLNIFQFHSHIAALRLYLLILLNNYIDRPKKNISF